MKIFALETDLQKLIKGFLSRDEQVVATVRFSAFLFVMRSIKGIFSTIILTAIVVGLAWVDVPLAWTLPVVLVVWVVWVLRQWIRAYIDWKFDVLIVTTEEIVIVNQSSIIRSSAQQMNLDNIASVSSETQFGNLFPFGRIKFDLKEGTGKTVILSYIPHAHKVSSIISDAMVVFQRRRAAVMHAMAHGASPDQAQQEAQKAAPVQKVGEVTDRKKPPTD